jgi:hypothetical protein
MLIRTQTEFSEFRFYGNLIDLWHGAVFFTGGSCLLIAALYQFAVAIWLAATITSCTPDETDSF